MKKQTLKGTLSKKGRKYIYIDREYKGKTYTEKVVITEEFKAYFKSLELGQEVELNVESEEEYNSYKHYSTWLHTPYVKKSEEEEKAEREEFWMDCIRNTYNEKGYMYRKGLEILEKLGCTRFDEEIAEMQKVVDCNKAIRLIREKATEEHYIYNRMIDLLHKHNCHEYDEEIEVLKKMVANYKAENYISWSYPLDLKGLYEVGEIRVSKGKAWRITKVTKEPDGRSFGFDDDWFYMASGINVTDTKEGQAALEKDEEYQEMKRKKEAEEKEKAEYEEKHINPIKEEMTKIYSTILMKVNEHDELKGNDVQMPSPARVFYDSTNIYGSGKKEFIGSDDKFWIFHNNSMDGDDWSRNHINNSGTGVACSIEKIKGYLDKYIELEKQLEKEIEKFEAIYKK